MPRREDLAAAVAQQLRAAVAIQRKRSSPASVLSTQKPRKAAAAEECRRLSKHFTLDEFKFSRTAVRDGLDNTDESHIEHMRALCLNVLEPLRTLIGKPIRIMSGYRSPKVNAAVGEVDNARVIRTDILAVKGVILERLGHCVWAHPVT